MTMNKYEIPVDNISNEILDKLIELYKGKGDIRIIDRREEKNYFLFSSKLYGVYLHEIEFTFIWIDNNLWQYRFINPYCSDNDIKKSNGWINPEKLLYKLVHNEYLK